MPLPTSDNDWDLKSGSIYYFDNSLITPDWSSTKDASPELKDVARNLSQALGVPTGNGSLGLSGGYIYEKSLAYKGNHAGIDFSAGVGTPIKAVVSGTVENVSYQGAAGYFIAVHGIDGKRWIYGHVSNSRGFVNGKTQTIQAGQEVGKVFNQIAPHLHLEVHTDFSAPVTGFFQNSSKPASIDVLQQKTMSPLQAYWQSKNGGVGTSNQPTERDDTITGNSSNNNLTGLGGNDTLYGEGGNDFLNGGNGNDYLDGYASVVNGRTGESDTLIGGTGIDKFVLGNARQGIFYQGQGNAIIKDYNPNDDYIYLRGNADQYSLTVSGNNTEIRLKSNPSDVIGVVENRTDMNLSIRNGRQDFKFNIV